MIALASLPPWNDSGTLDIALASGPPRAWFRSRAQLLRALPLARDQAVGRRGFRNFVDAAVTGEGSASVASRGCGSGRRTRGSQRLK